MGVPGLFRHIVTTQCSVLVSSAPVFHTVFVDANAMLHPFQGDLPQIMTYLRRLTARFPPRHELALVFDGPAPYAKQVHQRQRRFVKAQTTHEPKTFDTNQFTPGTRWFAKFQHDLHAQCRAWKDRRFRIRCSPSSDPGEGEHKILDMIRQLPLSQGPVAIVGNDADLLLLGKSLDQYPIYLLRPAKDNLDWGIVDLQAWDCNGIPPTDWFALSFLGGNDFLPHLPGYLMNHRYTMKKLEDAYRRAAASVSGGTRGHTCLLLEPGGVWHWSFLRRVLEELRGRRRRRPRPRPRWSHQGRTRVMQYQRGLEWITKYYLEPGVPSWNWHYPGGHVAPTVDDMIAHVESYRSQGFRRGYPAHPWIQLACVLPKASRHLLPEPIQAVMDKYPDMYPTHGKVTSIPGGTPWQQVVELSPLCRYSVAGAVHQMVPNLPAFNSQDVVF